MATTLLPPEIAVDTYQVVNSIFKQMTGRTDIVATDSASLIAMGNEIANMDKGSVYLNNLCRKIGMLIDGYRLYEGDFSDFKRSSFQYGAYVQKLHAEMPDAVEDVTHKVGEMDGQSVDQYIISNPKVTQKIFDVIAPYTFFITLQEYWLQDAFNSAGEMQGLISYIFGQCRNKMEATHENLGRLALANIFVNLNGQTQVYPLRTIYNNLTGNSLTLGEAMFDPEFLRFAIGFINNISRKMRKFSVVFNAEGKERFTPESKQTMFMLSDFQTQLETVVQYEAFHDEYVKLRHFISVPYWQAVKDGAFINNFDVVSKVILKNQNGAPTTVENIIGAIVDYEAFGTFRQETRVATTPVNARALYYNTFWHERQMYFNDLGENAVMFTLN